MNILAIFASHYSKCNIITFPDCDNEKVETICFQLVSSILVLNTDLHNKNVKNKISINKFTKNWYKFIDVNKYIEPIVLRTIYKDIINEEFKITFKTL